MNSNVTETNEYKYNHGDFVKCVLVSEENHEKLTLGMTYRVLCGNVFDGNIVYTLDDGIGRIYHSMDRFEKVGGHLDSGRQIIHVSQEPVGEVSKFDVVEKPSHYNQYRVEVIDIIEDATKDLDGIVAVCLGNALKYLLRFKFKNGIQDLKKARWYLDKMIKTLEDGK